MDILDPDTNTVLAHGLYNGTSDLACVKLWSTVMERDAAWGACEYSGDKPCICGQTPRKVILQSHYGGCFSWPSQACLTCMTVVGERDPFAEEWLRTDGCLTNHRNE